MALFGLAMIGGVGWFLYNVAPMAGFVWFGWWAWKLYKEYRKDEWKRRRVEAARIAWRAA
jgi:hypothetical protein